MKKIVAMLLLFSLLLVGFAGCMPSAEGEEGEARELRIDSIASPPYEKPSSPVANQVDIIHERMYVLEATTFPAVIYIAEVKNVGTASSTFTVESLDILNDDNSIVATIDTFFNAGPSLLEPGDSGFVTTMVKLERLDLESMDQMKKVSLSYTSLPSDAKKPDLSMYSMEDLDFVTEEITFTGTVHNTSSENADSIAFFVFLRDKDGNVLIAEDHELKNIKAGGSASFQIEASAVDAGYDYEEFTVDYFFFKNIA